MTERSEQRRREEEERRRRGAATREYVDPTAKEEPAGESPEAAEQERSRKEPSPGEK